MAFMCVNGYRTILYLGPTHCFYKYDERAQRRIMLGGRCKALKKDTY